MKWPEKARIVNSTFKVSKDLLLKAIKPVKPPLVDLHVSSVYQQAAMGFLDDYGSVLGMLLMDGNLVCV